MTDRILFALASLAATLLSLPACSGADAPSSADGAPNQPSTGDAPPIPAVDGREASPNPPTPDSLPSDTADFTESASPPIPDDSGAPPGDIGPAVPDAGDARPALPPDAEAGAPPPGGPVLAFPGAVGFAAGATGGRRGSVYHVTTLTDSGPGSFRDAVSAGGRIIVFDIGGYIVLTSAVVVHGDLTIAGQTAPGQGIGLMGRELSFANAANIIVRNIRARQGDLDPAASKSGFNLLNAKNVIFDHVSIEFAQWNNIDAVGASNVTVQFSIDADPIGQQFNAHTEGGPFTWYRTLFANAHNRNPLAKANTQYVNNVIYDFQAGYTAGNSAGVFTHDTIANAFVTGPATTNASNAFFQMNGQKVYANGNIVDSTPDGKLVGTPMGNPGGALALSAAWSATTASLPTLSAAEAYANVVAHAGALPHDGVDALVIADVTSLGTQGSLWTTQTKTGLANSGYGTLTGGTKPVDTDGDGMPDVWETKYGLDPHSAVDASSDFDHTGYSNIEKYVNGLLDGSYP